MKLRKELIGLSQGKYEKEEQFTMKNWHKTNQCTLVRNEFRLEIRSYLTISRLSMWPRKIIHFMLEHEKFLKAVPWLFYRFENEKQKQKNTTNKQTKSHTHTKTPKNKNKNKQAFKNNQRNKQTNKTRKQTNKTQKQETPSCQLFSWPAVYHHILKLQAAIIFSLCMWTQQKIIWIKYS